MALKFPRAMPTGAYQSESIDDDRQQSQNIDGGGEVNVAELGPMLWHGKWSGETRSPEERSALEAWVASMQGGLKSFRGAPVAGRLPLAHRFGWGSLVYNGAPFLGLATLSTPAQRSNLLTASDEFEKWAADVGISVLAEATLNPDDNGHADRITAAGVAGRGISKDAVVSASTLYTGSVSVRLGSLLAADFVGAFYDATNAAWIAQDVSYSATLSASGWVRVSASVTTPPGCALLRFYPFRSKNATAGTFYLSQAQINAGPVAPYIATTDATASYTPLNDEIALTDLPDGVTLQYGDWLSFQVANTQRLFKVLEGGTSVAGSLVVTIEPPKPLDAIDGVKVRLEDPYCEMRLATAPTKVITNYQMGTFSFEGIQKFIGGALENPSPTPDFTLDTNSQYEPLFLFHGGLF